MAYRQFLEGLFRYRLLFLSKLIDTSWIGFVSDSRRLTLTVWSAWDQSGTIGYGMEGRLLFMSVVTKLIETLKISMCLFHRDRQGLLHYNLWSMDFNLLAIKYYFYSVGCLLVNPVWQHHQVNEKICRVTNAGYEKTKVIFKYYYRYVICFKTVM